MRFRSSPKPAVIAEESLTYHAPETLLESSAFSKSLEKQSIVENDGSCAICLENFSDEYVQIKQCHHCFHYDCIRRFLQDKAMCPLCRKNIGPPQGLCPSGTMEIEPIDRLCPGFGPLTKAIIVKYKMPSGAQSIYHENPGLSYQASTRTTYLPANREGIQLLDRLKFAWSHGLTFSVGTSLTTRQTNCIVWSSIHHKTSLDGGPHGFPDSAFIKNCNDELTALGVPPADARAVLVREVLHYTAPPTLVTQEVIDDAIISTGQCAGSTNDLPIPSAPMWYMDDCAICNAVLSSNLCVQIRECGDYVHYSCLVEYVNRNDITCPCCAKPFGEPQGRSPSGSMTIKPSKKNCPGFAATAIEIVYNIPKGRQRAYHEHPGKVYGATIRTTYLPQTVDGCLLLQRLKYAWMRGLVFSIGTSKSSGVKNCVVWDSGIPHKTILLGGPFGFPDPSYLDKCNHALDALGVPSADACVIP